jgi:outer membrane protein TolC
LRKFREAAALTGCFAQLICAQQAGIAPVRPEGPLYKRPYMEATVPPVQLGNSPRLASLIRAGKLYLSPHDAVALALENNIDIEMARYQPLLLEWNLERSEAGGALPGVPSGSSQAGSVASGQGVQGSQAAAGVGGGGGGGGGGNAGNATISQVGPVVQTLDPSFQEATTFSHRTTPQPNPVQSQTSALVDATRNHLATYQQGFLTGGGVSVSFRDSYLKENAPTNTLNPSVAQSVSVSFQQNLLRGLGIAVNERNIVVARNNLAMSDLAFRTTVERTVATVLNAYWTLSDDYEDVTAKQDALNTAQRFLDDNQRRVDLGDLAPFDLISSKNQLAQSQLALVNSKTALAQDELQMKNLISRVGTADPVLEGVSIVPTGTVTIPDTEESLDVKALVAKAFANRSDLKSTDLNLKNSEISGIGTKNGLLPAAQAFGTITNSGLAGAPHPVRGVPPDSYFVGGTGTALRQIFGRDFPTENIGAYASVPLGNRQAQADYGIDQLQLRQDQLTASEARNQVEVDVTNSVVALRQARARYQAAHANTVLQQQLVDGEQKKFTAGESTSYNVIQTQRDLAAAKAAELSAVVSYQSAKINLDAITGTLIEENGITLQEAKTGQAGQ